MKYLYFTLAKLEVSNVVVLSQNLLSNCQNLLFVLTSLQFHGNVSVRTSFIRYSLNTTDLSISVDLVGFDYNLTTPPVD